MGGMMKRGPEALSWQRSSLGNGVALGLPGAKRLTSVCLFCREAWSGGFGEGGNPEPLRLT